MRRAVVAGLGELQRAFRVLLVAGVPGARGLGGRVAEGADPCGRRRLVAKRSVVLPVLHRSKLIRYQPSAAKVIGCQIAYLRRAARLSGVLRHKLPTGIVNEYRRFRACFGVRNSVIDTAS